MPNIPIDEYSTILYNKVKHNGGWIERGQRHSHPMKRFTCPERKE